MFFDNSEEKGTFARYAPLLQQARSLLAGASARNRESEVRVRAAAYLIVDYVKCLLFETARTLNLRPGDDWPIPKRVDRIRKKLPELDEFDGLLRKVEKLRGLVAHHERKPLDPLQVRLIMHGASGLKRFLDKELVAMSAANTPSETIQALLERCSNEVTSLDRYSNVTGAGRDADRFRRRLEDIRHLLTTADRRNTSAIHALQGLVESELKAIIDQQVAAEKELEDLRRVDDYIERQSGL